MAFVNLMCWMVFAGFFLFAIALIVLRIGIWLGNRALIIGGGIVAVICVVAIGVGAIALSVPHSCGNCGGSILEEDVYCGSCGMGLRQSDKEPEVTICLNCGAESDTAYCKTCGAPKEN